MEFLHTSVKSENPIPILGKSIATADYCPIDLSMANGELRDVNLSDAKECQAYVTSILTRKKSKVAYGGYLEQRNLYARSERFQGSEPRNIHLGVDFWCDAGTKVLAPLDGLVHSFANNADFGNYGPTIILTHNVNGYKFHTLYGHLSLNSLEGLYPGKVIEKGDTLAELGTPDSNVGYAPHLHFQLIRDISNYQGDYPGVCSKSDLEYFRHNCPDPNLLLGYNV